MLVETLAGQVTALPGRNIMVDMQKHRLYVHTETQTYDQVSDQDATDVDSPMKEHTETDMAQQLAKISATTTNLGLEKEEACYMELSGKLTDLKTYLHEVETLNYKSVHSYSTLGSASTNTQDPVQKVKAEIRSVKGSLLNARTFQSTSGTHNRLQLT